MPYTRHLLALLLATLLLLPTLSGAEEEEDRELVTLDPMQQKQMQANMRDHLAAINEIIGALAEGDYHAAGNIAEQRLGVSARHKHGRPGMGASIPDSMRAYGLSMHQAASNFPIAVQDAQMEEPEDQLPLIFSALQEITDNCDGCHSSFRIR
ncbi:hypothetical protein [Magnetococcus sp. PR-3]|uniref:hypothetical protein n=1 Tax=Magnetococcus sp. PR-3 TaxID=3120355 RepID=UPI002FCE31AD